MEPLNRDGDRNDGDPSNGQPDDGHPLDGARVLVTGGAGFVGRAVAAGLAGAGADVTVLDREEPQGELPGRFVLGDVTSDDALARALAPDPTPVRAVVHLAAVTSVLTSARHPSRTFETNVTGTQRLLEHVRRAGVARVVMASTNAVVGDVGRTLLHEGMPLAPLTPYGATKAAAEMLLSGYSGAYGVSTCALRFTNIYGPGMAAKDSIVARLMRAALSGATVQVYGDGHQVRDYVYVDDVVSAVSAAVRGSGTGPVIVGSGRSVSVLELLDGVRRATGRPLPAEHVPAPDGEMPAVLVNLSHAAAALGYTPTVHLDDGLREVWREFSGLPVAREESGRFAMLGHG